MYPFPVAAVTFPQAGSSKHTFIIAQFVGWSSGTARLSCDICFGSRRLTSGCHWHWSHLRLRSSSELTDDRRSSVPSPAFRVAPSSHLQTSNSSSCPACASDLLDFPFPLLSPAGEKSALTGSCDSIGPTTQARMTSLFYSKVS